LLTHTASSPTTIINTHFYQVVAGDGNRRPMGWQNMHVANAEHHVGTRGPKGKFININQIGILADFFLQKALQKA